MAKEAIKVTANEGKPNQVSADISINMPANLEEMVSVLGKEVVYAKLKQKVHIDAVNCARTLLANGKLPVDVVKVMADWKPSIMGPKKPATDKYREAFSKLTKDERKKELEKLRAILDM